MIQVNSIEIPVDIQELCADWAGGTDDMLYAVSSTGDLTLGSIRPRGCDTEEKWYLTIWREFASDLDYNASVASFKNDDAKSHDLNYAKKYADVVCAILARVYGLEDWDACEE